MEQLLSEIVYWHWLIFVMFLLVLEMLMSGFFFLWLGVAATSVGVFLFFHLGIEWEQQGLIFTVLSLAHLVDFHFWREKNRKDADNSTLNKHGRQYIGRALQLKESLINGCGRAPIDDGVWQVRTENEIDIDARSSVGVVDVIKTTLTVKFHEILAPKKINLNG